MSADPKVVFIAGWGRSGSTVLNRVLAGEGTVGVGEMRWLWRRGVLLRQDCSCGEPWDACPVWRETVTAVAERRGEPARSVAERFDRRAAGAGRSVRALRPGGSDPYVDLLRDVYGEVARAAHASIVIDSSKDPLHARLARRTGLDVTVVHLVRDPRAVVWSHQRAKAPPSGVVARTTPTRPAPYVAARWLARNTLVDAVVRPDVRLRYEDMVRDPDGAAAQVYAHLGHPIPRAADGAEHVIAGNPGRFDAGPLVLEADDEWTTSQPARQRRVAAAIGLPLMGRYGYRVRR